MISAPKSPLQNINGSEIGGKDSVFPISTIISPRFFCCLPAYFLHFPSSCVNLVSFREIPRTFRIDVTIPLQ